MAELYRWPQACRRSPTRPLASYRDRVDHASVTVIIPTYNPDPSWLQEAVDSAVAQEPAPLEVLVIDDGSSEPVAVAPHPLVRVVRQQNGGVAAARNHGLALARGDFVAFLDHDDRWLPGKLAAQLERLAPGVGLCSTAFDLLADGTRSPGWGGPATDYRHLLSGNPIGASTVVVRRDVLKTVGGFTPGIAGAEDWEAWLRVARVSLLEHVPEPLVLYRVHEHMVSGDYRQMWRGSMRVLWLHRRALPVRGARRMGVIYGAQAFDAYRTSRALAHLLWAVCLAPDFVAGEAARLVARRSRALLARSQD